jgi:hypothetical protein
VLAGSLAAEAVRLRIVIESFVPRDSPVFKDEVRAKMRAEWDAKVGPLASLERDYGLHPEVVTRVFEAAKGGGEEADRRALYQLAEPISNHSAFIGDALVALRQAGGKENTDKLETLAAGKLEGVTLDGDTARATLLIREDETQKRVPLHFRRVGENWRIDLAPHFLKAKR